MPKPTILVTGGAGFIGSHVNKMLHKAGYQTVVLDNLIRGNQATVRYGTFIQGDLANTSLLNEIFEHYPIAAVMHFAAFIDVGESVKNPSIYYLNNVSHTLNLLAAMQMHNIKNFIFSSTAAIFGQPQENMITEEHPCHPINPYGLSKWMVEKILQDFDKAYELKFCCLRYFNAAGGDPEGKIKNYQIKPSNLIPLILQNLKKTDSSLTIFGTDYPTQDGTCVRDYIHIEDLGHAHIKALEYLLAGSHSNVYNLGNGKGFSVREVIQAVEAVLNKKISFLEGKRRLGDPAILLADSTKAARELNWFPHYSLENMITHAWKALE